MLLDWVENIVAPAKTGEFDVPGGGKGPYWAHPVVCGGRLYIRHSDKLFAYNIKQDKN